MTYLTKDVAAKRLGISVRRLMELSAAGLPQRHRKTDPKTQRSAVMFLESDVERARQQTPVPLGRPAGTGRLSGRLIPPARPLAQANLPTVTGNRLPAAIATERIVENPAVILTARPWLSIAQASAYSGLSARTVLRLIRSGALPALDEGTRGTDRWKIHHADLDALRGTRSAQ